MKPKSRSMFVALLAILTLTFFAPLKVAGIDEGPTTTTPVVVQINPENDPERIADAAMLGTKAVLYRCNFNFKRVLEEKGGGQTFQWVNGWFVRDLQGFITRLHVGDDEIPIDPNKPLRGLNLNAEGTAINFNAWCYGMDSVSDNAQQVSYGHYNTRVWGAGEPITFEMIPNSQRTVLAYKVPEGMNPNSLVLRLKDGNTFSYNSRSGGFDAWLDPLVRNQEYEIVDTSSGNVIQRGSIDPFSDPVQNSESAVNINWAQGVREIMINQTNRVAWFGSQQLTTNVKRDEGIYPARVYYVDMKTAGLSLWFYGLMSGGVQVYEVNAGFENLLGNWNANLNEDGNPVPVPVNLGSRYNGKLRIVVRGGSSVPMVATPYGFSMRAEWVEPGLDTGPVVGGFVK